MISLVSNFLFTACFTVFLFKFFFPVTAGTWVDMVFLFDGNWAVIFCVRVSFTLFIPGVPWVPVRSGVGLILLQNQRASLG